MTVIASSSFSKEEEVYVKLYTEKREVYRKEKRREHCSVIRRPQRGKSASQQVNKSAGRECHTCNQKGCRVRRARVVGESFLGPDPTPVCVIFFLSFSFDFLIFLKEGKGF